MGFKKSQVDFLNGLVAGLSRKYRAEKKKLNYLQKGKYIQWMKLGKLYGCWIRRTRSPTFKAWRVLSITMNRSMLPSLIRWFASTTRDQPYKITL